jgi:hypothetical protein
MPDSFTYPGVEASFDALLDGREYSQEATVHELNVPWGNTVVVQRAGNQLPHLNLDVLCQTQTQVNRVLGGLNQSGTLVYWGGTHSAVLTSATEANWWDPEWRRMRLRFTITG